MLDGFIAYDFYIYRHDIYFPLYGIYSGTMGQRGLKLVSERYDFDEYLQNLESFFVRISREHALPA